ncbi:hypothetical protein PACTADRAFT_50833 [Pachysolen tannophilus NRRL Y-2460]|uniref:Complex 1 LYR protein domain-containing protein n=1 Tax=Pachysolen tannophilus NRRL Y-2460 TaxID=669874 RepID=A0A1E4TTC4_PACTA|nr:hypothetical protein PACTADRAFT_50833 [Pachysolen tannophilus NRRL Y-2460]
MTCRSNKWVQNLICKRCFSVQSGLFNNNSQGLKNNLRKRRILNEPVLSLDEFILRNQIKTLYRRIIRSCKLIGDKSTSLELMTYTKEEFRIHDSVKDHDLRKYLLSKGLKSYRDFMKNLVGLNPEFSKILVKEDEFKI